MASILPTVETRRGRHVYALAAPGSLLAVREALGKVGGNGAIDFADGELRADVGCYSVLPPSKHPSGAVYRWLIPLGDEIPTVDLLSCGWVPCNRESAEGGEYREDGESAEDGEDLENTGGHRTIGCSPSETPEFASRPPDGSSFQDALLREHWQAIDGAIQRTLPTGYGQRHLRLFELGRELELVPALASAPLAALKPIVGEWHRRALAQIRTKTLEESWFDFCESWDKVKFPRGQEPMTMIVAKAMEREVAKQYEQRPLQVLVAVCRELQRASGEGPFFLSVRTAGKYLGVTHVTASRWLRGLQHDGILRLVEKGSQSEHKASRYRYLAGM